MLGVYGTVFVLLGFVCGAPGGCGEIGLFSILWAISIPALFILGVVGVYFPKMKYSDVLMFLPFIAIVMLWTTFG